MTDISATIEAYSQDWYVVVDTDDWVQARIDLDNEQAKVLDARLDQFIANAAENGRVSNSEQTGLWLASLEQQGAEVTLGLYGDGSALAFSSFNHDNVLSSDISVWLFTYDGEPYVIVQDCDNYSDGSTTVYADTTDDGAEWFSIDSYQLYCTGNGCYLGADITGYNEVSGGTYPLDNPQAETLPLKADGVGDKFADIDYSMTIAEFTDEHLTWNDDDELVCGYCGSLIDAAGTEY